MKRCLLAFSLLLSAAAAAAAPATHLMRYADIHGDKIVFTYEDDLWLVTTAGGDARRITSDPGTERFAKFSPDGKQIAFTASYDGGTDVYVMPADGGVPKRLTWHPAPDLVLGWHPDGKRVLFRSIREYPTREFETYLVPVDGGMPEKLPIDRGGLASLSPDGKRLVYNRISRENRTWKRYRGGMAQDVWLADFSDGSFRKLTDWDGTDNFPMWSGDRIVFTSDREDGTLNLYSMDATGGDVKRLTRYTDYDVKYPSCGTGEVVFQYGEQLHVLDLKSGAVRKIDVRIPSDLVLMRPDLKDVAPRTGAFGLSPGGERLLLEDRGDIFNLPVDEGDPVDLTHSPGSREKDAAWSPDGRWIAMISDRTGEEEIWLVDQRGGEERRVTDKGEGFLLPPVWSPDSKMLLFSDKFMNLNLVDVASGRLRVIDTGDYDDAWERWGIQDYCWSPDSRWIAYTKQGANMNESIWLCRVDGGEPVPVTDDRHEDWSPSFSRDGRYLYFLSNRTFNPIMGRQDQDHVFLDMARAYLMLLAADENSPFLPGDGMLAAGKDKDAGKDEKGDGAVAVTVDLDGIGDRVLTCGGLSAGDWYRLEAIDGGFVALRRDDPVFLKYQNVDDRTTGSLELVKYDLGKDETTDLMPGLSNYHLSADGKKLVYRCGSSYGIVDAGATAAVGDGEVDLSQVHLHVAREKEFPEIFDEAWRIQRDWFYDPHMNGVDWPRVRDKYRRFVPDCATHADLNYLIGEMIAELNEGHTYVYGGDFEDDPKHVPTGLLGARFAAATGDGYYRIDRILRGRTWKPEECSPLARPGCPVRAGDYLIAIDGEEIPVGDNVYRHLADRAGKIVTITYNDRPSAKGARTCRVETLSRENALIHRDWVERNHAEVEKWGAGRVAYMHLPNMGESGLTEFGESYYPQTNAEAFIIDERYNGGGFTGDMIIDRLERRLWSMNQPREGGMGRNPERCFHGPIVVLINEDTGSNGEYFAYAIKYLKLATLIGMRTWGGAVGIEPHQDTIDGTQTTPPQFAPIGMDGTWIIEGHGVDPDVVVQNMPADVVAGKDTQLEKAVTWLLDTLDRDPARWKLPERPPYPDKAKAGE